MPPPGTNVSIERAVFPKLVSRGLFGFAADGYWIDIGTPARYLQGTFDILEGNVRTGVGDALQGSRGVLAEGAQVHGRAVAPALIAEGSTVEATATVGGRAVLGRNVSIGPGSQVEDAVLLDGVSVGSFTRIRSAIIGPSVTIGDHCVVDSGAVVGQGVKLGPPQRAQRGSTGVPRASSCPTAPSPSDPPNQWWRPGRTSGPGAGSPVSAAWRSRAPSSIAS